MEMMNLSEQEIAENLKHPQGDPGKRIADFMKDGNSFMYDPSVISLRSNKSDRSNN